ncbi:MAG: AAA family ATPase [Chloroflexota bacterium]|nr:AAA family ATPase [Chloroflexota bacterium]
MIFLQSVRCRNFKALTELELHVPPRCAFLIEGANEAGKTSLLDAIYFAFSGTGPDGVPARQLVRRGEDEASVVVEFAGDDAFGVIERSVPRQGAASVRMKLERRFQIREVETEAKVQEGLAETFGLDMRGLARVSFLRELDLTAGNGDARALKQRAVVERREIGRTHRDLADVSKLRAELETTQKRIALGEMTAELEELRTDRADLERRLRLMVIAGLRDRYEQAVAEVGSVEARLSGLGETRDELRRDLDLAERQAATTTVVDTLQTARAAVDAAVAAETTQHEDTQRAREAGAVVNAATERLVVLDEALQNLDTVATAGTEREDLQRRKDDLDAALGELERLRGQRATLVEARASIEAELTGIRQNLAGAEENGTAIGARKLWAAWIETFGMDAGEVLARGGGRFSPGGMVSRAVSRLRGTDDDESSSDPARDAERAEIEAALRGNGIDVPEDVESAVAMIRLAAEDLPAPVSDSAEALRVTDENLVSVIVRATRLDASIRELEDGFDGKEAAELEAGIAAALANSAEALRSATAATDGASPPERTALADEATVLRTELPELKELVEREPELACELERRKEKRERAEATRTELMDQLREIWPEKFAAGATPLAEDLDRLRTDCLEALERQDPLSLNRQINEVAAQISSGELALDVVRRQEEQALAGLEEKVRAEGVVLQPGDVGAALGFALPDLGSVTAAEEPRTRLTAQREQDRITEVERSVGDAEQRLGERGAGIELGRERSRAEELERQIGVRLKASEIAARAQERLRAKAVPKTIQNARTLLPLVTGNRYFDLRLASRGEVELWDEAAGGWARLATMAFGTRRQVGLALRLAEAIAISGPAAPGGPAFMVIDEAALGSDAEHRARISAVLREGFLRETFAQVIVLVGEGDFRAPDFDRQLTLSDGHAAKTNGRLKASGPKVISELRREADE